MKIAFILPSLANQGPIIFTKNLILGLLDLNCQIEVFYFNPILELDFPVKCTQIPFYKVNNFIDFDIVHSTMAKPDCYLALHYDKIKPVKVSSMHCFMMEDLLQLRGKLKTWAISTLWKWALRRMNHIIVSSDTMLQYYTDILNNKSIQYSIIPYGIPIQKLGSIDETTKERLNKLKSNYSVLIGCGSLIKRKGFAQLIDYLPQNQQVAVLLIGDGECRNELCEQAKRLGVQERVFFLGYRTHSVDYYPYGDIFCMTSNSEGFGLAMLEAMSLGLPFVCAKLDIYNDYFHNDQIALFDYGNLKSLAIAIERTIDNKADYSQAVQKLFTEKFSLTSMAQSHYDQYNQWMIKKTI
ncbi:MAG: glycosyltransferase family 4 protein [Bacteroidales bacterium]